MPSLRPSSAAIRSSWIWMSTPAGRWSSRWSESTVFGVGCRMSISRLCVRISKCSRESLSLNGDADHAVDVLLGGQRHGPGDARAGALRGLHDLARSRLDGRVVVGLEPDPDLVLGECCHWNSVSRDRLRGRAATGPPPETPSVSRLRGAYSTISDTTPEPTVRPPSRIAKRRPWSMAIGWISSTSIWTLSPGMTISTPSGRLATPVTSVVRK